MMPKTDFSSKSETGRRPGAAVRRAFLAFVLLLCLLLSAPFPLRSLRAAGDEYNDDWVMAYENMQRPSEPRSVVPTLFKNDAAFANYRRFPLVVQNGVHYVPIEMFLGLSGITLTYGYSISYFYLSCDNGNRYISFDVDNNLVTTHQKKTYTLETKLFYNTRYLPAKDVADVLGINMEIYDSIEDGIYAVRFCDKKAKLSFSELAKLYIPIDKETPTDEPNPPSPPVTEDPVTTDDPPVTPDDPPVIRDIGRRTIYLTMDISAGAFGAVPDILAELSRSFPEKCCVFFVAPADVLTHADEVRQILAAGQHVGLLLESGSINTISDALAEGLENLRLTAKCTTRFVRFRSGSTGNGLSDEDYARFVAENGLRVWDYNVSAADSAYLYDRLYDGLYRLSGSFAAVRILPGRNTADALERLASLIDAKTQLRCAEFDETALPFVYR